MTALRAVRVDFDRDALDRPLMDTLREVPGSEFELPADLVLLAMGFVRPGARGPARRISASSSTRGATSGPTRKSFATSEPGVFAAGDARRGQSLVVWAQWEGREAARAVDAYLVGRLAAPRAQRLRVRPRAVGLASVLLDSLRRGRIPSLVSGGHGHSRSRAAPRRRGLRRGGRARPGSPAAGVESLVERYHALRAENAPAPARSSRSATHLLLELNQRRQDALKRIDDLIAQIDELDARFESESSA